MASISQEEEKATKQFIKVVNEIRLQHNAGPMSFNTGLKFMMARKFDVHRALSLYEAHEITRFREGLAKFDPLVDPVKTELETGKFTVLPTRDSSGAAIAIFTACKHIPTDTSHQTTLQGVVYQLDIALEDVQTQRSGIVFVYNMSNSKYANFDYELSQKILGLLKGAYPARLKKVLIVTAPLWFKAPFKILRLFVREKLRDRVFMINVSQLPHHIPLSSLPKDLGGHYEADHASWIKHCYENGSKTNCDLYDLASFSKFSLSSSSATQMQNGAIFCVNCTNNVPGGDSSGDLSQLPSANGSFSDDDEDSSSTASGKGGVAGVKATNGRPERGNNIGTPGVQNSKPKPENIQVIMPETSPHSFVGKASGGSVSSSNGGGAGGGGGNSGMSLEEFIQYMKSKGRKGLYEEYNEIKSKMPAGTFDTSRLRVNQPRNRYTDVLCYDHSIVKLAVKEGELGDPTEYINANFVDGYEQKNAFISTQGPLPKTFVDFWKMVWQQNVCVIVMTTRTIERCRTKCGQYWPLELNTDMKIGPYQIFNNGVEQLKDYVISSLVVSEIDTGLTREVAHMQFTSWPDYGVPHSALAMLDFRDRVRTQQAKSVEAMGALWKGHPMGPPIVVHCSAGIGRTGTFITLDISILRLEATGTINIKSTVEKIRAQRAYSIQMPDQYVFCYLALLEYALVQGLLQDVDLSGFEESESEFEE